MKNQITLMRQLNFWLLYLLTHYQGELSLDQRMEMYCTYNELTALIEKEVCHE